MSPRSRWGGQVNGGNEGCVGTGPLSGARIGERFALALISLALDDVDATEVLRGLADAGGIVESQPTVPSGAFRGDTGDECQSVADTA